MSQIRVSLFYTAPPNMGSPIKIGSEKELDFFNDRWPMPCCAVWRKIKKVLSVHACCSVWRNFKKVFHFMLDPCPAALCGDNFKFQKVFHFTIYPCPAALWQKKS